MGSEFQDPPGNDENDENWAPVNENPEIIGYTFQFGVNFLQTYGWFVIVGFAILAFLWSKLQPWVSKLRQRVTAGGQHALYDADAETIQARSAAMEAARRRLQEQHDAAAAQFAERKKQEEELMRQKKIEDWENHLQGKGYRSKVKPSEEGGVEQNAPGSQKRTTKPRLRDPSLLHGDDDSGGASCRWRPSRRGPSAGGG